MQQIVLSRVMWSPNYSQVLTGYDVSGEFVHTERVFVTCKEDIYIDPERSIEYVVQSWAPDGRGYVDGKKEQ
ncbi:hypothetical protein [Micromonospora sp. CB01531]|uniref:hypothetical protein n=1 Tax=Micromonospora sp. CB01531 TaxID=1718947 RepID=UPI00093921EF|nr:hypothetical protein [Micromonospora sp. CB01531]OKI54539.1 hypothetical protein A6A27_31940 [Micromonospora sp. CB01531]